MKSIHLRHKGRAAAALALVAASSLAAVAAAGDRTQTIKPLTRTDIAASLNAFGVLSEARTAADALPRDTLKSIRSAQRDGVDALPSAARRVSVAGKQTFYLVPGRKWICLYTQRGSGTCNHVADALNGKLMGTFQLFPELRNDVVRVFGAVPDGVAQVALTTGDDRAIVTDVVSNTYVFDVDSTPKDIVFVSADGKRHVRAVPGF